jgi:hypothetical protein
MERFGPPIKFSDELQEQIHGRDWRLMQARHRVFAAVKELSEAYAALDAEILAVNHAHCAKCPACDGNGNAK